MMAILSEQYFIAALLIGAASGVVGALVILRRMALVGDALSHVALPGIALALAFELDPFWGALLFLLLAAWLVWWLEKRTRLPGEAIVGILFTASLAAGVLGLPNEEILESLFGSFAPLTGLGFLSVAAAALAIIAATLLIIKKELLAIFAPEIAAIANPRRSADLVFLLLFSSVVAIGIKLVGTLLMGALTIIPASIAKNVSRSMTSYIVLSGIFGGAIAGGGALLAAKLSLAPGPVIILAGVLAFIATLFVARR